jgi:hypothetical protein
MPVESWGTGEARGLRRKWYIGSLIVGVAIIIASLAIGRPVGSLFGVLWSVGATVRLLSIKGAGLDPSKSAIQRLRNRELREYGNPLGRRKQ